MDNPEVRPGIADEKTIGKLVVDKEGYVLGTITGIRYDDKTGVPEAMVIAPSKEVDTSAFPSTPDGRIVLPSKFVMKVTDVVIYEQVTEAPEVDSSTS